MKRFRLLPLALMVTWLCWPCIPARAQIVLETQDLRLSMDETGLVRSLVAKPSGREHCWSEPPRRAFTVVQGNTELPASAVTLTGDDLQVVFGKGTVTAHLRLIRAEQYVALRLQSIEGERVAKISLLRLRIRRPPYLGRWVNAAYDDEFGICLCAGSKETNARMSRPRKGVGYVNMAAVAYKEPGFDGTLAVLFGCPKPKQTFLERMAVVERDLGLPLGAKHRQDPAYKYSYLWVSPTPDDIHEYIRWARRGGFRMILFSYTAFTRGAGHFVWNDRYPNGMADLKKVTDAVRAAGLALGLHIHYNKAHKTDPYVTPVPDDRLHQVRRFTLAGSIDDSSDALSLNENPKGCTLDDRRRVLKVGNELITYQAYTTEPPYRFTGCKRGAQKTTASAHEAGAQAALLDVDTWPIFIRFDQNTDIQDEAAERIAAVYRETGPYDMVYFDGAEDVHAPRWYHTANAVYRVHRHFDPPPPVCEAAANTHFSWHMVTRSNAYDSVAPAEMKAFCRKAPCRSAPDRALNFSRVNFGWLHGFGRSPSKYIGPDVLEYILSRGAAWDCPFSMTVSRKELGTNPRTEDCFGVIKMWEDARIDGKLTDAQRQQLKNLDQEHHLFINERGEHELVPIHELPQVAKGRSFKAYTFARTSQPADTYVLIWSLADEADLMLDVPRGKLTVMRPFGTALPAADGNAAISIGDRHYLVFADTDATEIAEVLRNAKSSAGVPTALYLPAKSYSAKVGQLALASTQDEGALGECIVPTAPHSHATPQNWYVDYTFDLPYKGRWYLWGRMKYKDTNSNSFFSGLPGVPGKKERFGNSYVWGKWLWELGSTFRFDEGRATVRVYVRESAPNVSPLLDVLCLTNDAGYEPNDELAAAALGR